jgi:SulP family sulfate permease
VFSFVKLRHVAEKNGLHLVIAALPAEIEVAMRAEGVIGASDRTVFTFDDLDHALEWCERRLLEDVAGALNPQDRFKEWLAEEMGEATLAARFLAYLDPVSVAEGEALFRQGDPPDALYFIAHGRVSIMFAPPEGRPIRLRSMTDCTVVGEMGIYRDLMRTASVIAEEPTRTYRLERAALERMEREDLDVALAFHALIVRTLADRLAFANDEVAALER